MPQIARKALSCALTVLLCAGPALPVALDAFSVDACASSKSTRHTHKKLRIPTSSNLSSQATSTTKARYHYVCSCGKQYKSTYAYGYCRATSIATLQERYAASPGGGIAFTGSSLLSHWDSLASDLQQAYGYPADMVYNLAIGGWGFQKLVCDDYVDAVAALEPAVVVVSSANDLRYKNSPDTRSLWTAATGAVQYVELYIEKLRRRLPNVKVLVMGGIKSLSDYQRESLLVETPITWQRIDLYNAVLERELSTYKGVRFVNIEPYFMGTISKSFNKGMLGFYCNGKKLKKKASLKPAYEIVKAMNKRGKRLDPYFRSDLLHPTARSYAMVYTPYVGRVAVKMICGS